jgi:hypothetical protein
MTQACVMLPVSLLDRLIALRMPGAVPGRPPGPQPGASVAGRGGAALTRSSRLIRHRTSSSEQR